MAQAGADLFSQFRIPIDIPLVVDVKLDPGVLLFALLISMLSAVLFGLAPALQSTNPDLIRALKSGGAASGRRRRLLGRNALVIAQVAGSLLLLVFATQAYRGARRILFSAPGFRTTHILTASFNPTLATASKATAAITQTRKEAACRTPRQAGIQLEHRLRCLVQDGTENQGQCGARKGPPAGSHLVK